MRRRLALCLVVGAIVVLGSIAGGFHTPRELSSSDVTRTNAASGGQVAQNQLAVDRVALLHVPFIRNLGQVGGDDVAFYAPTFGGTVYLSWEGDIAYSLPLRAQPDEGQQEARMGWLLRECLEGGLAPHVQGLEPSVTRVNDYLGNDLSAWRTDLPTFQSVSLGEVYDGIALSLRVRADSVEKLFEVAPEADPGQIRVAVEGASGLSVTPQGELEVQTGLGTVRFSQPVAYQEIDGRREQVAASYCIDGDTYSFDLGSYDPSRALIIDPLLASTFIGGGKEDLAYAVACDAEGNVYLAGSTSSEDYPLTSVPGPYTTTVGSNEVLVSKLDSELHALIASTVIGGSGDDSARDLALSAAGDVYIAGDTSSADFPADQAIGGAPDGSAPDAFVCKLDGDLGLQRSVTIHGEGEEWPLAVAVGQSTVYVAGYTDSVDYPVSHDLTTQSGGYDAFVTTLDTGLTGILASARVGGQYTERDVRMGIDPVTGDVCLVGYTVSPDFPTTSGAYHEAQVGFIDAFVSMLPQDLSRLDASTYLGGKDEDYAQDVVMVGDSVYVAGYTKSGDFIHTEGRDRDPTNDADIFVCQLGRDLASIRDGVLLGGGSGDYAMSLAVATTGNVYVAGWTMSDDYPVSEGAPAGFGDIVVAELDASAGSIVASARLGGSGEDDGLAVALDGTGGVYVAGSTNSDDFPTTAGAFDPVGRPDVIDDTDAVVAKLGLVPGVVTTPVGPIPTLTGTDTSTPTITDTPSPSPSPTLTSTPSQTPTPTDTLTPSPTPTSTSTPSPTPSPTDTSTPSPTPSPTDTSTPTATPTPTDTSTPTPTPSVTPTYETVLYQGRVVILGTEVPVGGASVAASFCVTERLDAVSGADGSFVLRIPIPLLECDSLVLDIHAVGYEPLSMPIAVDWLLVPYNQNAEYGLIPNSCRALWLPLVLRGN